jgi:hypothetical protein
MPSGSINPRNSTILPPVENQWKIGGISTFHHPIRVEVEKILPPAHPQKKAYHKHTSLQNAFSRASASYTASLLPKTFE